MDVPAIPANDSNPHSPTLRLWPPVLICLLVLCALIVPTVLAPGTIFQFFGMMLGPIVGAVLFALWWLFLSRRPVLGERLLGGVWLAAAGGLAFVASHESTRMVLMVQGITSVLLATTLWFLVSQRSSWRTQLVGGGLVVAAVFGYWCLVRSDGVDGMINPSLAWRWSPTAEEEYLQSLPAAVETSAVETTEPVEASSGDWIAFRGPARDGRLEGVAIATDWSQDAPQLRWRRPIGPAWSSFTVVGKRLYTQEQRGEEERVVCLDADSGQELWAHADTTRFWEAMAGAGPRATPTFDGGLLFALGANGTLNCLDAVTGEKQWSTHVGEDTGAATPAWGFASSPLVWDDLVMAYGGGGEGRGLAAYDRATGELRWTAGGGIHSYSSPQRTVLAGVEQVLMLTEQGVFALLPDGQPLWQYDWHMEGMNRSVQPNVGQDCVYIGTGFGNGTRRVDVQQEDGGWQATADWTSKGLKPYYNDFVIHDGYLYGFDGNIFACVDAQTGKRKWKRGRYGNGQVLLLADQGLLLVMAEQGDVVLLRANPEQLEELGRVTALEGKTWNHPVIAHGNLYVRNAEEAASFALTPAPTPSEPEATAGS